MDQRSTSTERVIQFTTCTLNVFAVNLPALNRLPHRLQYSPSVERYKEEEEEEEEEEGWGSARRKGGCSTMVIERKKWILRCVCVLVIVATLFTFRAKFGPVPLNAGQQHYRPSTSTSPKFNRTSFQPHKGSFTSFDSAPSQFLVTQSENKKIIITNASLNTSLQSLDPFSTEVTMMDSLGGGSTSPVLLNATFAPLTPNDIRDLRTFVMFVGFGKTELFSVKPC